MGTMSCASKAYNRLKNFYNIKSIEKSQRKKMNDSRRMKIANNIELTNEQKEKIQTLFLENYGKKISTDWHRYYQGISGEFSADYIPETQYSLYERLVNKDEYAKAYSDKILQYELLSVIPEINPIELYFFNRSGVWYDNKFNPVSADEAKNVLKNNNTFFYKPINDTSSGVGCGVFDTKNKTDEEILNFLSINRNVMLQRTLTNCKEVSALHAQSLNTFRIMTYSLNGVVYHCPTLLRMGCGGNNIDNAHAGGIFIGVEDSGILKKTAHSEFGEHYTKHPDSGIEFEGYKIEKVPQLLNSLKKAHNYIQHLGVISWDAIIDEKGDFFVVEINTRGQSPWLVQMASGRGMFGENTKTILNELKLLGL